MSTEEDYDQRPLSDRRLTRTYYSYANVMFQDNVGEIGKTKVHVVKVQRFGKVGVGTWPADSRPSHAQELACRDLERQLKETK